MQREKVGVFMSYKRAAWLWATLIVPVLVSCNVESPSQPSEAEPSQLTWEELVAQMGPTTYSIGFVQSGSLIGVGSGVAINDSTIATNAHVVLALKEALTEYGDTSLHPVAVQNGGVVYGTDTHFLNAFAIHPGYSATTTETFDFGIVTTKTALSSWAQLASASEARELRVGQEIGTIGFPGELNPINTQNAVATFKNGTISALRAFGGAASTESNSYYVQHNLSLSGGTSGSPIFNRNGKIVAINNSGIVTLVYSSATNTWERIPIAALGFGIRADQFQQTLHAPKTAFSSLEVERVTYTFINDTWSDVEIRFLSVGVSDTIGWKDTLSFWDNAGNSGQEPIQLRSLVATNNYLTWVDTLTLGQDFSRSYIVTDDYFLLGVENLTNRSVRSIVVSNVFEYDSSAISIPVDGYRDVGYYRSSSATDFRMYFNNTGTFLSSDNQNTTSSSGEAIWYPISPTNILSKPTVYSDRKADKSGGHRVRSFRK